VSRDSHERTASEFHFLFDAAQIVAFARSIDDDCMPDVHLSLSLSLSLCVFAFVELCEHRIECSLNVTSSVHPVLGR